MANEEYTKALITRLEEIREEISQYQEDVRRLFRRIETKQQQAEYIIKLLEADGIDLDRGMIQAVGKVSVTDVAFNKLKDFKDPIPMHYRDLANTILSEGIPIPGKDPAANLLSQINRDDRFVRVTRGTYGLKEWGMKPINMPKRKKSRKRR